MRIHVPVLALAASACATVPPVDPAPVPSAAAADANCAEPISERRGWVRYASAGYVPPPPMPPGPPQAPDYITGPEPVLASTNDPRLDRWRQRVLDEGGPAWRPYLLRAFAGVRWNPAIPAAFEDKPADVAGYLRRYLTPERIAAGQRLYRELRGERLFEGEQRVPLELLLALWGALSDYGANLPRFDMIEAIAHAGACGREPWGSFGIYHAVRIIAEGRAPRARARAYASGRIGQNRLFPEQYLNWAEDGDGDGRVDLWSSRADILRNLHRHSLMHWNPAVPAIVEIEPVSYDPAQPNEVRRLRASIGWEGVHRRIDGRPWPAGAGERMYGWNSVVRLGAATFLVSPDVAAVGYQDPFRSVYHAEPERGFAVAIALLAERIAGRPPPSRPIG